MTISIPRREDVSAQNRKYFDFFEERLGQMPNLYAMMGYAQEALDTYLRLQNRKQALTRREREAVGLVIAALNDSSYCLESHTRAGRLNDLTDEQLREIAAGSAVFDPRLDALVRLAHAISLTRGKPQPALLERFFSAGYLPTHLVDLILCIGDNTIANLLCQVMVIPPDEDNSLIPVR